MRRREWLRYGGSLLLASPLATSGCASRGEAGSSLQPSTRFPHGVASGDPSSTALRLWTRVATSAPREQVRVIVARDPGLRDRVAELETHVDANDDHTLHVEVGGLQPGVTYHYAFETAGDRSSVGRARTTSDASIVRLGFTCCGSLAHGWLHTYRALASRPELDAVVHLGDYIYEYASGHYGSLRAYEPPHATLSLEDYRARYAQYRREPELQALHAAHPMIATWDDHEVANNAWPGGSIEHDHARGGPWSARRAAAARAYAEWIPFAREREGALYRSFRWGDLVELFVLDTRSYRDAPPRDDAEARAAGRSLLGEAQRRWLLEGLARSSARWKIVISSVQLATHPEFWNFDAWDGYADERRLLLEHLARERIDGVVVVCGDGHKSFADELALDPHDPASYDPETGRGALAVELMTPAASSPNLFGADARAFEATVQRSSPHTRFVEAESRGFWTLELTPERARAELRFIDGVEDPEGGQERPGPVFEMAPDEARLVRVA